MQSEALQKIFGSPVKDTYGRFVGSVIGLSIDTFGAPKSIGIDHGGGNFVEYENHRIIFNDDNIILIPTWKIGTDKIARESIIARKRAKALEDLLKEGEISEKVYESLYNQFNEQLSKIQKSYSDVIQEMKNRLDNLNSQKETLEKYVGKIKVQSRTGEIDEEVYQTVSSYLESMLIKNNQERADISNILDALNPKSDEEEKIEVQENQSPTAVEESEEDTDSEIVL
jgi:hypothetical protein